MSRIEEIEAAIDGLPPEEYRRIVQWFRIRGKLNFLFDEADSESANGLLREWPSQK